MRTTADLMAIKKCGEAIIKDEGLEIQEVLSWRG